MRIFTLGNSIYYMSISIVTTTRGRPGCFALLERWVARQTVQPVQWLVVGEDHQGYRFTMGQEIIKRKSKKDTLPSICENWLAAIPHLKGDRILVMEDDDYYHEEYIATLAPLLDDARLAGVKGDLYYKLPIRKYQMMGNQQHASLAATVFTSEMIPFIERCRLHKSVYIDCYLWSEGTADNADWRLIPNKAKDGRALHVGMKMMPGANGLGMGHQDTGASDKSLAMLTTWIGAADTRLYRSIPQDAKADWMPS